MSLRHEDTPLYAGFIALAIVVSFLFAVAAVAQEPEPGVGLIVRDGDVVQYATPPEGCPSTGRINTAYNPWEAAGWNPYLGSPPPLEEPRKAARWQWANACRYGGYPGGLGCPPWPDGEWEAWYRALPPGCITGGAVSWSQHGTNAERWLRAWGAKFGRGDVQPTSLEKRDYDVSRTVLCRVHNMLGTDVCSPSIPDPVEPDACCKPEGPWECSEVPADVYERCTTSSSRCTVWESASRANACDSACWMESGGTFLPTTHQVVDTPRCRPGGGAEGPGDDEEDDPPPEDEEDDEEPPPPPPAECDLTPVLERLDEIEARVEEARAAARRQHDEMREVTHEEHVRLWHWIDSRRQSVEGAIPDCPDCNPSACPPVNCPPGDGDDDSPPPPDTDEPLLDVGVAWTDDRDIPGASVLRVTPGQTYAYRVEVTTGPRCSWWVHPEQVSLVEIRDGRRLVRQVYHRPRGLRSEPGNQPVQGGVVEGSFVARNTTLTVSYGVDIPREAHFPPCAGWGATVKLRGVE